MMVARAFLLGVGLSVSPFGCGGRTDLMDTLQTNEAAPSPDTPSDAATDSNCPEPSQVNSGLACTIDGLTCPSGAFAYDCNGQPTMAATCNCGQGMWSCAHVFATCPPAPTCPVPATMRTGETCVVPSGVICPSATPVRACGGAVIGYVPCACTQGLWACRDPGSPSCVDASMPPVACPDPTKLVEGAACSAASLQCRGNPTLCKGATFYDALQCDGTRFVTVAMTVCGIDAGTVSYAGTADAARE
ncbi:MAG: hypothetical protein M3O46_19090 [Myxococcota bacterium]|nr:hypothetical protein [Myxococcota bacterium]